MMRPKLYAARPASKVPSGANKATAATYDEIPVARTSRAGTMYAA